MSQNPIRKEVCSLKKQEENISVAGQTWFVGAKGEGVSVGEKGGARVSAVHR